MSPSMSRSIGPLIQVLTRHWTGLPVEGLEAGLDLATIPTPKFGLFYR
jgi:hypothetical protein